MTSGHEPEPIEATEASQQGRQAYLAGDLEASREWYEKAVELGADWSVRAVLTDLLEEIEMTNAAAAGDASAMTVLGHLANEDENEEKARMWWEKAAGEGDADAMFELGVLEQDSGELSAARGWYQKASALGNEDAAEALDELD